jgi:hypothetical protein
MDVSHIILTEQNEPWFQCLHHVWKQLYIIISEIIVHLKPGVTQYKWPYGDVPQT